MRKKFPDGLSDEQTSLEKAKNFERNGSRLKSGERDLLIAAFLRYGHNKLILDFIQKRPRSTEKGCLDRAVTNFAGLLFHRAVDE